MKKIFASFVIISVLSSATLVVADDVTDVQTRVTQIKTTDPTLPAISEQK